MTRALYLGEQTEKDAKKVTLMPTIIRGLLLDDPFGMLSKCFVLIPSNSSGLFLLLPLVYLGIWPTCYAHMFSAKDLF